MTEPDIPQATKDFLDALGQLRLVYRERSFLVAYLASQHPSYIGYTDPAEPKWAVVTIRTPAGQMSWHIAPEDRELFEGIPMELEPTDWDGHTTEMKYDRLYNLTRWPPTITCPDCGWSSPHPDDIANGYCGNCHVFEEHRTPGDGATS